MLNGKAIKKHVAIIHAYSLMGALQRKIFNALLYEITKEGNTDLNQDLSIAIERRMPLINLSRIINFNSKNIHYLKEALDGLASIKIEWNLLKDKAPKDISFLNLRVLHGAPTFYKDGTVNFSFHRVMLYLMENPLVYGTIDMDIQCQFESKYSHSLYENSTRSVNLQKNIIVRLEVFRKLLGIHEETYPNISEFRRKIITPSVEEVNHRADFTVRLEEVKDGRKLVGFQLFVNKKNKIIEKINHLQNNLIDDIKTTFGMDVKDIVLTNILKMYEQKYILEKIEYTKNRTKKDALGFYPIAYFMSALKNDYKSSQNTLCAAQQSKEPVREKNTLCGLQADINHWESLLAYAKSTNNILQIESIEKVLFANKEKFEKYMLELKIEKETSKNEISSV